MNYTICHHGTYWFQIRVPEELVPCYGRLIRQNLRTREPTEAKPLALKLASEWLQRFAAEKSTPKSTTDPCTLMQPAREAPDFMQMAYPVQSMRIMGWSKVQPVHMHHVSQSSPAQIADGKRPAPATPPRRRVETPAFDDTIDGLVSYWRRLHPECVPSTYREVQSVAREFRKFVRKTPPSALQRTDIAAFRDDLIRKRLKRATISKKVGFISTLLQSAYDAGHLPQNVARGLKIPKAKVADVGRRAFTEDELARIFRSPVYARRKRYAAGGGEAAAWVPVLALATGARLEELCQLRVDDVYRDEAHGPLVRICDDDEGQRVKTTGSRRVIPLHPDVVQAGFLVYRDDVADNADEWLFPRLEPDHDGRRGGTLGQWFARYLRSSAGCGIRDRQVVFHSFRHTFKSLCRGTGIPEEVHDALTGHVGDSVGRRYGEVPLAAKVEAIRKIQLPVQLPRIHE